MTIIAGTPSFERALIEMLRVGYDLVKSEPEIIDELFPNIPQAEREEYKTWIGNNKMDVALGYPNSSSKFPAWRVVVSREMMVEAFLGDFLESYTDDQGNYVEEIGELWQCSYNLHTYTDNGDITSLLYYMLKMIMHSQRETIECFGFMDLAYQGQDLVRDVSLSPQVLYQRVLTVTGKAFFSVPQEFSKITGTLLENLDFSGG